MLEVIVEFLLEIVLGLTGYAVMFVCSFGRVRPKAEDDWLATIVGLAFWACFFGGLYLLSRA